MNPEILAAAMWYIVFVISTTCHEAAHAWTASHYGDDTARRQGLVTLNPLPHIQYAPIGMLLVPLAALALSGGRTLLGWGMAPYSPDWAYRYPKRAALMALAGPAANLLLAVVSGLILREGLAKGWFMPAGGMLPIGGMLPGWQTMAASLLVTMLLLNSILFVLNLVPIPPFDGGAVVMLFLPEHLARGYQRQLHDPNAQMIGQLVVFWLFAREVAPRVYEFALRCVFA